MKPKFEKELMISDNSHPMHSTLSRGSLINELMLDMIANTDCSWNAAVAAIAFWQRHIDCSTAPVYGIVEFEDEKPNVVYDSGKTKRSLKIGCVPSGSDETYWMITIQS